MPRRCADAASRCARCASTSRTCWCTCGARWSTRPAKHRVPNAEMLGHARGRVGVRPARRLAARAAAAGFGRRLLGDRAGLGPIPFPGRPRSGAAPATSRCRRGVVPGLVATARKKQQQERGDPDGRARGRARPDPGRARRRGTTGRGCRVPRNYRRSREQPEGTVERFCERVADYKATVERVPADGRRRGGGRRTAPVRRVRVAVPPGLPDGVGAGGRGRGARPRHPERRHCPWPSSTRSTRW